MVNEAARRRRAAMVSQTQLRGESAAQTERLDVPFLLALAGRGRVMAR
jgi:hypothetical protein